MLYFLKLQPTAGGMGRGGYRAVIYLGIEN
jgi:hypothetical protein